MSTSKSVVLKHHVLEGLPSQDDFEIVTTTVDIDIIADDEIVIHAMAFSADPYLRGSIKATGYNKPGSPMIGFIAGKVIASKNADWIAGDLIGASLPFSTL